MWRNKSRPILDIDKVKENAKNLHVQIETLVDSLIKVMDQKRHSILNTRDNIRIVFNSQWLSKISLSDFLNKHGSHFQTRHMLSHEGIKSKLNSENGLSFKELSYQIIQALDFAHLYETQDVNVQIGGSDQWGNISSGLHLINKLYPENDAFGITLRLLVDQNGMKIGKSSNNSICLNPTYTSPFDVYQYFYDLDHKTSKDLSLSLTFDNTDEIFKKYTSSENAYQEYLAFEVTRMLHGSIIFILIVGEIANSARALSKILSSKTSVPNLIEFWSALYPCRAHVVKDIKATNLFELLANLQLAPSKSEIKRLINSSGVYINGVPAKINHFLRVPEMCTGHASIISLGRKSPFIIKNIKIL